MKQALALVLDHQELQGHYRLLTLEVPEIAAIAQPGQFVHVRCGDTLEPLLRRPISLHKIEAEAGRISLLYHVVGRGTRLLAGKKPGEQVDIMGPLGHGFTIPTGISKAVVVGGGIGAAPLLPLIESLVNAKAETTVILGARCADLLIGSEPLANLPVNLLTCTEDGSAGQKGLVTDVLNQVLEQNKIEYIYSCGPKPMLRAVTETAKAYQVNGEVSLEERMGCGVGACLACACKVLKQDNSQGDFAYKRVCDHGPVFSMEEVLLDD